MLQFIQMTGCSGSTPQKVEYVKVPEPIKINENFGLFAFSKLISRVGSHRLIGGHYEVSVFSGNKYEYSYSASDVFIISDSLKSEKLFQEVVNSELNKAGYKIVGNSNSLFEQTENQLARFMILAEIINLVKNTYIDSYKPTSIKAEYAIIVNWEIHDQQEKKVIFTKTEKSSIIENFDPRNVPEDVFDFESFSQCVKISFDNLLANKELVNSIKLHINNFPSK